MKVHVISICRKYRNIFLHSTCNMHIVCYYLQLLGQNEEGQLNNNNVIIPDAPGHDGIQFSKCLALSNIDGTSHGVVL